MAQARYFQKHHALVGATALPAKLKWDGTSCQMLTAIRQKYQQTESRRCEHLAGDGKHHNDHGADPSAGCLVVGVRRPGYVV